MNTVSFTADNTEHDFILTTNAIADVEEMTGKSLGAIINAQKEGDVSITVMRAMLYAGVRAGCRRVGRKAFPVDAEGAGDLVDALGMTEAMAVISRGVAEAFPDAKPDAEDETRPVPPNNVKISELAGSEDFSNGTKSDETAT